MWERKIFVGGQRVRGDVAFSAVWFSKIKIHNKHELGCDRVNIEVPKGRD